MASTIGLIGDTGFFLCPTDNAYPDFDEFFPGGSSIGTDRSSARYLKR
ncbi:MAG: hypothetical protein AB7G25_19615 [Sphingomonadaceae bacterium]